MICLGKKLMCLLVPSQYCFCGRFWTLESWIKAEGSRYQWQCLWRFYFITGTPSLFPVIMSWVASHQSDFLPNHTFNSTQPRTMDFWNRAKPNNSSLKFVLPGIWPHRDFELWHFNLMFIFQNYHGGKGTSSHLGDQVSLMSGFSIPVSCLLDSLP